MIEQRVVYTSYGEEFDTLVEAEAFEKDRLLIDALERIVSVKYAEGWSEILEGIRSFGFDIVNTLEEN